MRTWTCYIFYGWFFLICIIKTISSALICDIHGQDSFMISPKLQSQVYNYCMQYVTYEFQNESTLYNYCSVSTMENFCFHWICLFYVITLHSIWMGVTHRKKLFTYDKPLHNLYCVHRWWLYYIPGPKKQYAANHHGVLNENDDERNLKLAFAISWSNNVSSAARAPRGNNRNLARCLFI